MNFDVLKEYAFWKLTVGVIATIGLYTILYRENRFYRLVEHVFLGLTAGWMLVGLWTETLKSTFWDKLVGTAPNPGETGQPMPGYWAYVLIIPMAMMAYMVFSKKHNWISRIPIGIIIGLWSGQQADAWLNKFGPQILASMRPIVPNQFMPMTVPEQPDPGVLYLSQSIGNLILVVTILAVLSYFFFSFDAKSKLLSSSTTAGRWLMMIGFGAIFGSTVMTRFTLLIDRMYFVWIEWLNDWVIRQLFASPGG